jgi:lipoprotein NlpD
MLAGACAIALIGCSSTVVRGPSATRAAAPPAATGKPGATVIVNRGDTLYSIASRHGLAVADVAAWNQLPPPYTIYPGQRLRLFPGSGRVAQPTPARAGRSGTSRPAAPRAATPAPAPVVAAPPSSGFPWRWPADGSLIGRYVAGEPTRQGIDVAGSSGAPVRAAAGGTVVYSGAGLVGYGELVIIKHSDAWLSAYGHNRKRLVNEGQLVKAGEQIAEMGRSGAPRDMLHFEIRYNGKPVDPLLYLPPH